MSIISARHTIRPYVAGTKPAAECCLVVAKFNKTEKNPNPPQSVMVDASPLTWDSFPEHILTDLRPWILSHLEKVREDILRTRWLASLETGNPLVEVTDVDLGPDAIHAFLSASEESMRISAESTAEWFDRYCTDNVAVYVCEKLGYSDPTPEQWERVSAFVKGQKKLMTDLCARGGVLKLTQKQVDTCRVVIGLASAGGEAFGKKLQDLKIDRPLAEAAGSADALDLSALMP